MVKKPFRIRYKNPISTYLNYQNNNICKKPYFKAQTIQNPSQFPAKTLKSFIFETELKHTQEDALEREAQHLASALLSLQHKKNIDVTILGPAKPPVHKIKNVFSRKIYLKGASIADIVSLWQAVDLRKFGSLIFFTPNPNS